MNFHYFALIGGGANPQTGDLVSEVFVDPKLIAGSYYPLNELYHPTIISWLVPCPANTMQNAVAIRLEDGTWRFENPAVPPPPPPPDLAAEQELDAQ